MKKKKIFDDYESSDAVVERKKREELQRELLSQSTARAQPIDQLFVEQSPLQNSITYTVRLGSDTQAGTATAAEMQDAANAYVWGTPDWAQNQIRTMQEEYNELHPWRSLYSTEVRPVVEAEPPPEPRPPARRLRRPPRNV